MEDVSIHIPLHAAGAVDHRIFCCHDVDNTAADGNDGQIVVILVHGSRELSLANRLRAAFFITLISFLDCTKAAIRLKVGLRPEI